MRLLLDTNTFVWVTDNKQLPKLGANARRLLEYSAVTYVSAATVAELKVKAGKKHQLPKLATAIPMAGLSVLDVRAEHADAMENSPKLDQFDRILLAQAQTEQVALMTANESLLGLGLNYVIDARQ